MKAAELLRYLLSVVVVAVASTECFRKPTFASSSCRRAIGMED